MAGEYILKLLKETTARVVYGDKMLVSTCSGIFSVYERKPRQKINRELIYTKDEEEACEILKGE